jgi:hypothetical protein
MNPPRPGSGSVSRSKLFPLFSFPSFASLVLLVAIAALSSSDLHAQAGRAGLISQAVKESDRVVLSGNVHPLATRANDRGAVDASMPADRMFLLLKRSPQQELALKAAIEGLHDKNSPSFHKWLTPAQFGAQWGAADSDIAAVTAWLQSHGFKVAGPTTGRTMIEFSGTAGQVQDAFHTTIHTYDVKGEIHHANATDPQIPAALAPVVAGVTKLNDFRPKSQAAKGKQGFYDSKTRKVRPALTAPVDGFDTLFVGPSDAATVYNTPNKALNPAYSGSTLDGTGTIIGIVGDSNIDLTQVANYRALFGLPANVPTVIVDGADPGENSDAAEAYLDIEVSSAIAPGASVYLYTSATLDNAISRAVNDGKADILNVSFGECEASLESSGNSYYESVWEQATAEGMSVTVASGDSGSAGCDISAGTPVPTLAYYGLQVNGLATGSYNIAVGGTDFGVLAGPFGGGQDFTKYATETSTPGTLRSALGYIPEVPWNDSTYTYPPQGLDGNFPLDPPGDDIRAGGGGASNCFQGGIDQNGNIVCTAGHPRPSWQEAPGMPENNVRNIPDVSFLSGDGFNYAIWATCTDQDVDTTNTVITECVPGSDGTPGDFNIGGYGGTSAAAPAFAGMLALVNQSTGNRQGQANYVLYQLARTVPAVFHDVVAGNNSVSCQEGTPDCKKTGAGYFYTTGYDAVAGYDLASGLGSVDVSAMIKNWAAARLASASLTLKLTPTSITHGQTIVEDATVTASGAAATGIITLVAEASATLPQGATLATSPLIVEGAFGGTGPVNLNNLPGGSYNVVANYGGSSALGLAQATSNAVAVTVSPETSAVTVSSTDLDPASKGIAVTASAPYGFPLTFSALPYGKSSPVVAGKVIPNGIATGTVTFAVGGTSLGTAPLSAGTATSKSTVLPVGTYTATATYGGDLSFDPSTGTEAVTITKATTKLALAGPSAANSSGPTVFVVSLAADSEGVAPTGTVILMAGTTTLGQGTLVGTAGSATSLASGTVSISVTNLPASNSQVTAVYSGDANYGGATSNVLLVQGEAAFKIADLAVTLTSEHSTAAGVLSVTSLNGYAGTVNLTCAPLTASTTVSPAECAMDPASIAVTANGTSEPLILIFGQGTKLPKGISVGGDVASNGKWLGAGGAVLALCLFFGVPARRRGWRSMIGMVLLLVALGSFSACSSKAKFISKGTYTFQVVGTDSVDSTKTATAKVTVTVL